MGQLFLMACQQCGGQLNIDGELEFLKCPYCGARYEVESRKEGGIRLSLLEKRVETIETAQAAHVHRTSQFIERTKLVEQIGVLERELRDLEDASPIATGCGIGVFGFIGAWLLLFALMAMAGNAGRDSPAMALASVVLMLGSFGLLLGFPIFAMNRASEERHRNTTAIRRAKQRIAEIEAEERG